MSDLRLTPIRLEVSGLALKRGERVLAEDVSFGASPGAYVEVTGPNGAGKTSLLRALAGLLKPISGSISLYGNIGPLDEDGVAAAIHLLGHRDGLKPGLDPMAHMRFWVGVLGGEEDRIAPALERVDLAHVATLPARTLSAGMSRRLALGRLIATPRPLWLLDEPAAALDRAGKALVAAIVTEHRAQGGIVIAAVHEPLGPEPSLRLAMGEQPVGALA